MLGCPDDNFLRKYKKDPSSINILYQSLENYYLLVDTYVYKIRRRT